MISQEHLEDEGDEDHHVVLQDKDDHHDKDVEDHHDVLDDVHIIGQVQDSNRWRARQPPGVYRLCTS